MGLDLGGIEFYAEPTVLGAPDDLEQVVKDFVARAKEVAARRRPGVGLSRRGRGDPGSEGAKRSGCR